MTKAFFVYTEPLCIEITVKENNDIFYLLKLRSATVRSSIYKKEERKKGRKRVLV